MGDCIAITKNGEHCKAPAQAGREYCFLHDPDKVDQAQAARSRGGAAIATLDPKDYKPWRGTAGEVTVLKSPAPQDVVNLLADTIDEVKTGRIDPRIANAVGYLAGMILKALEVEALEERLAAIEEAVGVKK